jgi:hypothetical protein
MYCSTMKAPPPKTTTARRASRKVPGSVIVSTLSEGSAPVGPGKIFRLATAGQFLDVSWVALFI